MGYLIPAKRTRIKIEIARSKFIATVEYAPSVSAAQEFIAEIRTEMPDANHHIYAYRVGHNNTITEGMTDDGEPKGTAAPPTLAVLRGSQIGDIVIVTTRYFGGTKLGTGGLVRAYSEAAQTAINELKLTEKIEKQIIGIETPYKLYDMIRKTLLEHHGEIIDEVFEADVTILAWLPILQFTPLTNALRDLSAGNIRPILLD